MPNWVEWGPGVLFYFKKFAPMIQAIFRCEATPASFTSNAARV
jgi:hypothetical protein